MVDHAFWVRPHGDVPRLAHAAVDANPASVFHVSEPGGRQFADRIAGGGHRLIDNEFGVLSVPMLGHDRFRLA